MASTGSKREAFHAGINPESNPINIETESPKAIFPKVKIISNSVKAEIVSERSSIMVSPASPPKRARTTASVKN